jgi:hypothetical protein
MKNPTDEEVEALARRLRRQARALSLPKDKGDIEVTRYAYLHEDRKWREYEAEARKLLQQ